MKRRLKKGFTLIELLVVIAIIGLMATLSVANFASSRDKAKTASANSFAHSLYAAQGADAVGSWNLDEGTGTTVYNNSGASTVPGTIVGATWITDGPSGKNALRFASGNYVSVGSVTTPVRVTVAAWIRTVSTAQLPFFSNRGTGLYIGISGGKLFMYYNSASPPSMSSNASINDNKWHHVAWSSDGTKGTLYVDGKKDISIAQTRPAETGAGYIGYDVANVQYFAGDISQLGVYSDTYTMKQIEHMYAKQAPLYMAKQ